MVHIVMITFKEFLEQQTFVDFVLSEFHDQSATNKPKPWSAKKDEIISMWRGFRNNMPIYMSPIQKKGDSLETYGEDGIRITGSWNFISAVLGRLKDIMVYENPRTRLRLVFRGVDKQPTGFDKPAYVFYVNLENRGS